MAAHLTATPRPLKEVRPEVPPSIAGAIGRALAKDPEDRIQTAEELRDAAVLGGRGPATRRRSRGWIAAGALLVAALVVLGGVLLRRTSSSTLDPDVVAVAPFEVLTPALSLWREGMVDLLSRNLDGAGSLRTVAPSTVIRRWSGRADPPSAQELGRRTGAGLAVFGQLVPARADSVRLTATLLEVASGHRLAELEFRDAGTSIDDLTDSLTVGLLRALSQSRAIGAVRSTALRSTSLPALKAFLQGEQLFRRAAWDSALAAYQRAVDIDSGFALAWRRMGSVVGWHVIAADSLSEVYSFRAGQLNHGLPPRDSLLVAADSLSSALYQNSNDTLGERTRRASSPSWRKQPGATRRTRRCGSSWATPGPISARSDASGWKKRSPRSTAPSRPTRRSGCPTSTR